jgi:uncharacterized protein YndB with AHSA1/START domain
VAEREPLAGEQGGTGDVIREIRIAAPPAAVFEFFTDPQKMTRWKGRSAELEPTPGGVYRVDIDGHVTSGEFLEVDAPRRVVFTWGWEEGGPVAPGSSTVEVELTPDGDGTLLRLTHRGLPEEEKEIHGIGWDRFLPRLGAVAAGEDPDAGS